MVNKICIALYSKNCLKSVNLPHTKWDCCHQIWEGEIPLDNLLTSENTIKLFLLSLFPYNYQTH